MSLELSKRAVACKGWRWMPGMRGTSSDGLRTTRFEQAMSNRVVSGWLPDFDDPATAGCLLALVREARGTGSFAEPLACGEWVVRSWQPEPVGNGASEAEALVAALEAAP